MYFEKQRKTSTIQNCKPSAILSSEDETTDDEKRPFVLQYNETIMEWPVQSEADEKEPSTASCARAAAPSTNC